MTITKQDIDNWIEREAFKKFPPQFASDQTGYDRAKYSRQQYIEAAQFLAPLLLQAVEAFHRIHYNNYRGVDQSVELRNIAGETLSQIEAAVASAAKNETKESI